MQDSHSKTTTGQIKPTADGFVNYLGFAFPKAGRNSKIAFAVKVFVAHDPPPFTASSLLDCIHTNGLGLHDHAIAAQRLRDVKIKTVTDLNAEVRTLFYYITRLEIDQVDDALAEVATMEREVATDQTLLPLAMLRQMFYGAVGGQDKWETLTKGLSASLARLTQPTKVSLDLDTSKIKPAQPDPKATDKVTGVPVQPALVNTSITFDGKGIPKIAPKTREKPLAESVKVEPVEVNAVTIADAQKRQKDCAIAIRNMLLVQDGRTRLGLSAIHDAMAALGYEKSVVLNAIDAATRTGELYMDGNALVPSIMLPSTFGGWGATIIDLNREKGWYDEEQLSEEAARALAKLSVSEQASLLKHMPFIPHREAKGRVDVATFCTNLTGEVSELWEAYRKGELDKPCDKAAKMKALGLPELTCAEEKIADILIRTLDTAEFWGINISRAVKVKHLYNESREYRHGNKAA